MSTYTSRDFLEHARSRHQFLTAQRHKLEAQVESFRDQIQHLEEVHERTRKEMASYLLADVTDEDLGALQRKLRYPGLTPIKRRFEAELERCNAERLDIEGQDEFIHNEFHTSQIEDELDALREACDGYRQRMSGWTRSRWFTELDGRGFFNHGYEPEFFDRFWDWRAVSWLMDDLQENLDLDFPTPDAVRRAWVALRDEATPVLEVWDELVARLDGLRTLKQRHDELLRLPEQIFQRMVEALSEAILDHLDACPSSVKVELARKDAFLVTFFKKEKGLSKQIQYLREVSVTRIQPLIQSLDAEMSKLQRKTIKAQRKFKYYDERTIRGLRTFKEDKWRKRHDGLDKLRTRIATFKRYDEGDFTEDYLWWDAMTRGASGQDIYEVRTFHRSHPHWDWRTYEDPWRHSHEPAHAAMDTAAPALADRMAPNNDDDFFIDAS